jgi:hypothetical protein
MQRHHAPGRSERRAKVIHADGSLGGGKLRKRPT